MYVTNTTYKIKKTGQIMVITAFVIAITFLLLATLLNIVIYAENQAARGITVADQASFETHTQVNNSIQTLVYKENHNNYSRSYTEREDAMRNGVTHIFNVHKLQETKEKNLYDTKITSIQTGTRMIQDTDREYTDRSGTQNWELASSTDRTRNMSQTVNRGSLYEVPNTTVWSIPLYVSTTPLFETNFDTSSGEWTVFIVEDGSTNSIYVRTVGPTGFYDDCSATTSRATLNYSKQTLDGNDCPALDFVETELNAPYSIEYTNGQSAEGQYNIHTAAEYGPGESVASSRFNSASSGSSPYAVRSIYSVEYEQVYISSNAKYDSTVYVAPNQLENETV